MTTRTLDLSVMRGLKSPLLDVLAPELVPFRAAAEKLLAGAADPACRSCDKRRRAGQLLQLRTLLLQKLEAPELKSVYDKLTEEL